MKKKLNNILLIDDSEPDNFINNRIINKANVTEKITVTYSAQEALNYLSKSTDINYSCPQIIFLDVNMPNLSGWDFLDEYLKLSIEKKAGIVICILTTSGSERDQNKAATYDVVNYFYSKPLTKEVLTTIIKENYLDNIYD